MILIINSTVQYCTGLRQRGLRLLADRADRPAAVKDFFYYFYYEYY